MRGDGDRLADELFAGSRGRRHESMASLVVNRQVLLDALRRLSDEEREALLLVGWDGLDHTSAAVVAGCSTPAFTKRLSRARQRLTELMEPSTAAAPVLTAYSSTSKGAIRDSISILT